MSQLADYLDGYGEFLDEHDRRALGLAPMVPAMQRAVTTLAPQRLVVQSPAPLQYAAPSTPTRLRAALLPAGRTLLVPFAQSAPTMLNPGASPSSSPASMPMAPSTYAVPTSGDVPAMMPDQTGSSPSSQPVATPQQYISTQSAPLPQGQPQDGGASGSASGTSGISTSTFGWLALIAGAYWIWKNVKE